ncbi:MAG: TonB-dependent receptor plug domain-containing protein [Fibrobacteria bacterium]|nr:TonB-dependent receptor plug domain-containing protein [Fibrobacteria bacterium]
MRLFTGMYCTIVHVLLCSMVAAQQESEFPADTLTLFPFTVASEKIAEAVSNPLKESDGLRLSTSTVSAQDIQNQNAHTVTEAVKYLPGAWSESRGRKVKEFISFRGQKYPYPDYAVDGVWQREFLELPYFFPTVEIERIDVMRSSAALVNGLSGLVGIINIVPKEYDKLGMSGNIEYGSFNTVRANAVHGNRVGNLSYAVGTGGNYTSGPEDRHGVESLNHGYVRLKWRPSQKFTLQMNNFYLQGKRELVTALAPASNSFQTRDEVYDPFRAYIFNTRGLYQYNKKMASSVLFFFTRRNHDFVANTSGGHSTTEELDWEWGANVIHAMSIIKNNTLRIGALYSNWVAPDGKRFFMGKRNDIHTVSGVIADEHTIGALSLDGGVRWVQRYLAEYGAFGINGSNKGALKAADLVQDEWESPLLNANLGASYRLPKYVNFASNLAFGFVQPREGILTAEQLTPDNEIQTKADVGGELVLGNIGSWRSTAFYVNRQNAISLTNDTLRASNGSLMELYENKSKQTAGIELEVKSASLINMLSLFANVTLMRHWVDVDGDYESDKEKPEFITNGGFSFTYGDMDAHVFGKYVSGYESKRFASEYHDIGNYFTLDCTAGYNWKLKSKHQLRLYGALTNITDKEFSTVVGYPDFGRRWSGGMQYRM